MADRRWRAATPAYGEFAKLAQTPAGMIVLVGLTWAFWQHLFSGLRHLVLDTGAGYELKVNRFWAMMTLVGSLFATARPGTFLHGSGQMSRAKARRRWARFAGLGSAHHGGGHWLEERFTSVALVLLSFWLVFSLLHAPELRSATLKEWLGSAWGAIPMALFVVTAFKHGLDGLKVAVDDYVHDEELASRCILLTMGAIAGRRRRCSRWPRSCSDPPLHDRLQDHRPCL